MQLKNRRKLEASLGTLVVRNPHHTHTCSKTATRPLSNAWWWWGFFFVQDKMVIPPELVDHIFNAEMDEAFEEDLKNLQVKLAFVDAGVGS